MHQDQESRTASLLRDQIRKLQDRLEFIEDSKIFQDHHSPRAVLAVPTFHIKLLCPRVPKKPSRESRMQRNTREFPEAFLIVNLPDESLKNHTMNQEIWQHHWGFREEKELRKVEVKNHCNQYFYFAFREKQTKNIWTTEIDLSLSLTMPRVSGLVLKVA